MRENGENRMTYLTLRWIYGNNREAEFLSCNTSEDIKKLVWKYMKPLFDREERKIYAYKNVKTIDGTTVNNIDGKPLKKLIADEIVTVIPISESLSQFTKGIRLVNFNALFEYLCDLKSKNTGIIHSDTVRHLASLKNKFYHETTQLKI
jgi:hypothetical protein